MRKAGRHPEAQEIGKAVQFGAELGSDLEKPCRAAIQAIENPSQE